MPADSGDRRGVRVLGTMGSHPQLNGTDQLHCPRCDSTSTKFCYYNNYNLSQPRYFCKSCRRYWTRGGTLRNVPVGGGTRKASKRSRSSSGSSPSVAISSSSSLTHESESHVPVSVNNPFSADLPVIGAKPYQMYLADVNLNETVDLTVNGDFTSFLNSHGEEYPTLGGYVLGSGSGFDGVWGHPGNGYRGGYTGGDGDEPCDAVGGTTGCNTWKASSNVEGGEGLVDGDCFAWPGLAISAPGEGLNSEVK